MKIKKLAALALSCAMVITGGALFAACGDDDKDDKGGFVEDTRIWFAVGSDSKGTLKDQGWNQNNSKYAFTKDTTVTNENVFTLSLDIYAGTLNPGRSFKFLFKETADEASVPWERQVGMQHLDGIEGSDADAVYKIDGETVFWTAEDNGSYNNIFLQKGQEGRYKFTLKTKSNTDMNPVISVERESKIDVSYDMWVTGDIDNFGATQNQTVEMVENIVEGSATTWTCTLSIKAANLYRNADGSISEDEDSGEATGEYAAVCILNNRDGKTFVPVAGEGVIIKEVKNFSGNKDYTCVLLKEGKYNVVFTENKTATEVGGSVEITENAHEMYLIGTINGWDVATATTEQYAMTEQADGSWTATITVEKDEKIKSYNKLGLTDADRYSAGADVSLTAGTWVVKYDPETNTIKVEKMEYYLVGSYTDPAWGEGLTAGKAEKLTETDTAGTFSCDIELKADTEFKIVYGTVLMGPQNWYGVDVTNPNAANFKATEDATYVVTVVVTDGVISSATFVKKA